VIPRAGLGGGGKNKKILAPVGNQTPVVQPSVKMYEGVEV